MPTALPTAEPMSSQKGQPTSALVLICARAFSRASTRLAGQQRHLVRVDREEEARAPPEQPQRLHRTLGAPQHLAIGTQLCRAVARGNLQCYAHRTMDDAPRVRALDGWTIVLGIAALGNLVNGAWMLAAPAHWYATLPAAVPDFGPLNEHLCATSAAPSSYRAWRSRWRRWSPLARCRVRGGGALLRDARPGPRARHDAGARGPEHWRIDASGVYVPAALMVLLTWLVARRRA